MLCIIPPVPNIVLGITLKLYELLLKHARRLDEQEKSTGGTNTISSQPSLQNENEWLNLSVELSEHENELRHLGCNYLDIVNVQDRLQAAVSGDRQHLETLAKLKDTEKKNKMKK